MRKNKPRNRLAVALGVAVFVTAAVFGIGELSKPPKTEIKRTHTEAGTFDKGKLLSGQNQGDRENLKTDSALVYESEEISTNQPKTNVIGIQWDQTGADDGVEVEMRTFDGKWSNWVGLSGSPTNERKDGTPATHMGLLVTENAEKVQYRLNVNTGGTPTELKRPKLTAIDATKGPDPTKKSLAQKLFGDRAGAASTAPRVYSRAEWGCPEATSSPRWNPDYYPLSRVYVHHTAAVNNGVNSAAAVRGIWDYHANSVQNPDGSRGWGDIGYNFIVDVNGNIFQGRYYDEQTARTLNKEVEGGHTYGYNKGSIGIAALGNFTDQGTTNALVHNIGVIAGYRSSWYGFNPGAGANLAGHRDAGQTNCPGNNLYNALNTVRGVASSIWQYYYVAHKLSYTYMGQGVNGSPGSTVNLRAGETATFYIDLRNDGTEAWSTDGATPVRIGTNNPRDHASSLYHASWIGPSRPGSFVGKVSGGSVVADSSITNGETARFQFTVTAPNYAGQLRPYYQPVQDGFAWFPDDIGIHFVMNVTPDTYQYQWLQQSNNVPSQPNTAASMNVTIKNTGNVAWSNTGPNPLRLGTERPKDRSSALHHSSWISTSRVATFVGKATLDGSGQVTRDGNGAVIYTPASTIAPGEAAHFVFTGETPAFPYVANEYFNFVVEGKSWLNDVGLYWPVNQPQNYAAQWVGQSAGPTIDKSDNPIGYFHFDFKNSGAYAWNKGDNVRLATSNPLDRNSLFAAAGLSGGQLPPNTTNWLTANRVGSFAGKVNGGTLDPAATVINPGETGRFTIALDARNVSPGTYREYFRMVADGFAWLQDYGAYAPIVVQP